MSNEVKFGLGTYFHGTKTDLKIGDYLQPGYLSNYESDRIAKYVYSYLEQAA